MDPQYDEIYYRLFVTDYQSDPRNLYGRYTERDYVRFALEVKRAIDKADDEILRPRRLGLRNDAKFMLLLNFMEMVIRPLVLSDNDEQYLRGGFEHDIRLLVEKAGDENVEKAGDENDEGSKREEGRISARRLVDTLTRSWKQLALSESRLWGA